MSILRLAIPSTLALALTACGGGGGLGSIIGGTTTLQCDAGTQVTLANPQNQQGGVPTNIGQITIVANGNSNALYNSYGQWNVVLTPAFSGASQMYGGPLSPADGRTLYHPYGSDYYYSSTIQGLVPGTVYNATLQEANNNCNPVPLGTFST